MSSVVISGDTSGAITLSAPAVAGTNTITLPANTGTVITTASTAVVTQAMLGTNVASNGPAFGVYNNTGQSVSTNTTTKCNFNTEEWDTNNNFASSRFTPTVAGYYAFSCNIGFQNSNSYGTLILYKNGSASRYLTYAQSSSGALSGGCMDYANGSTDYFEIYINIANGQNVNGNASSGYFQGALIRAA
jgi:hypothetical protein